MDLNSNLARLDSYAEIPNDSQDNDHLMPNHRVLEKVEDIILRLKVQPQIICTAGGTILFQFKNNDLELDYEVGQTEVKGILMRETLTSWESMKTMNYKRFIAHKINKDVKQLLKTT